MWNDGIKTFLAGEALGEKIRVKIQDATVTDPPQVVAAGAGEQHIGITEYSVSSGDPVSVKLRNCSGTHEVQASKSITKGTVIYGSASGKVSDAAVGSAIGIALEDSAGDAQIIEIVDFSVLSTTAATVSIADAGAYFAAAEATVEAALQKLAKGPFFLTFPRFTGWTKDGAAHAIALPAVESPNPIRIKRAYVNLGTAPGTGKTLALTLNSSALVSIAEDATTGEAKSLDIAIAANTDIVVSANETASGAGANCDIILVCAIDDGE